MTDPLGPHCEHGILSLHACYQCADKQVYLAKERAEKTESQLAALQKELDAARAKIKELSFDPNAHHALCDETQGVLNGRIERAEAANKRLREALEMAEKFIVAAFAEAPFLRDRASVCAPHVDFVHLQRVALSESK
jgi:hypothetical protein